MITDPKGDVTEIQPSRAVRPGPSLLCLMAIGTPAEDLPLHYCPAPEDIERILKMWSAPCAVFVEIEAVSDCAHCNGSREGQRWDYDLKQMVTVPNGCTRCCGEEALP